jgi:formate dehydrogenase major subunit
VQLIHAAAMVQLLLGNIGMPGGGVNAQRGHANIQGATDMGAVEHAARLSAHPARQYGDAR